MTYEQGFDGLAAQTLRIVEVVKDLNETLRSVKKELEELKAEHQKLKQKFDERFPSEELLNQLKV